MRTSAKPRALRVAALLAASSCAFSVACATGSSGAVDPLCPVPSDAEVDDYDDLERSGKHRPTIRWVGRLISYCWPDIPAIEEE